MSALAHHRLGVPGIRHHQPFSPREDHHLRLVWSRPESLAQHTYRRRRVVAAIAAIAITAIALAAVQTGVNWVTGESRSHQPAPATPAFVPATATTWTIGKGDTLWSIATAASEPGKDVRPLVAKLSKERGGKPLQLGERIAVKTVGESTALR